MKSADVMTFTEPFSFTFEWANCALSLQSFEAENKRLKKNFQFAFFSDGQFQKCSDFANLQDNEYAYNLGPDSAVQAVGCEEWLPLSQFMKSKGKQAAQEVFGIVGPKQALGAQKWKLISEPKTVRLLRAVEMSATVFVGWRFHRDGESQVWKPFGCGVFLLKMLTCKAGEIYNFEVKAA